MRGPGVLLAGVILLGTPSVAVGDEATVKDPKDDVHGTIPEGFEETEPVGTQVNTDLRRTRVDHRTEALVVKVRYEDLVKRASRGIAYSAFLNQPRNDDWSLLVQIAPSLKSVKVRVQGIFGDIECAGARGSVDPGKDVLRFRVPRSCIGEPEWIRYRGDAFSSDDNGRGYIDPDGTSSSDYDDSPQTARLYAG